MREKQIVNFLIWKGKKKFLEAWGLHFQVLDTEFILKRNITKKKKKSLRKIGQMTGWETQCQ